MESKFCNKCQTTRSISQWHKHKRSSDGLQYWCAPCRKGWKPDKKHEYDQKRYYKDGRRGYLDDWYKRKYRITIGQYEELFHAQQGVCAICFTACTSGRRLAVDHDHSTGTVRGLLCGKCNRMIGYAQDNIDVLQSAMAYLKKRFGK